MHNAKIARCTRARSRSNALRHRSATDGRRGIGRSRSSSASSRIPAATAEKRSARVPPRSDRVRGDDRPARRVRHRAGPAPEGSRYRRRGRVPVHGSRSAREGGSPAPWRWVVTQGAGRRCRPGRAIIGRGPGPGRPHWTARLRRGLVGMSSGGASRFVPRAVSRPSGIHYSVGAELILTDGAAHVAASTRTVPTSSRRRLHRGQRHRPGRRARA